MQNFIIVNKNVEYIQHFVKKVSNNSTDLIQTLRKLVYIKENTYEKNTLEYKLKRNLYKGFSRKI